MTMLVALLGLSHCAEPTPPPKLLPPYPNINDHVRLGEESEKPSHDDVGDVTNFLHKTTPFGCVKNIPGQGILPQYSACRNEVDQCKNEELPRLLNTYMQKYKAAVKWTECEAVQNPWCALLELEVPCGAVAGTDIGKNYCPPVDNSSRAPFKPSKKERPMLSFCSLSLDECNEDVKKYRAPHPNVSVLQFSGCKPFEELKKNVLVAPEQ